MAIVIPSKNIHSINFDPVIDNQIDKVEIEAKEIVPDNHYEETVYNEAIIENINNKTQFSENIWNYGRKNIQAPMVYTVYISQIVFRPRYITKMIQIPINQKNSYIKDIFDKVDKEGNPNIRISINGRKFKSNNARGMFEASFDSSGEINKVQSSVYVSGSASHDGEYEQFVELPTEETYTANITNASGSSMSVTSNLSFIPDTNITEALFSIVTNEKGENCYQITLKIYSDLQVYKLSGYNSEQSQAPQNMYLDFSMSGVYEEYLSDKIDITFYGNKIGIDLQENTVTIGNGNKIFSFDGNELIQTTNTPTQVSKYQSVIDDWKNGKQTATITCSISEYSDESGKLIKSTNDKVQLFVKCTDVKRELFGEIGTFEAMNVDFEKGDSFYITRLDFPPIGDNYGDNYKVIISEQNIENKNFTLTNPSITNPFKVGKIYGAYVDYYLSSPFTKNISFPFLFYAGDIVIPYSYTNNGDKPVSYNQDLTPKKFKVLGTSISKKQGVSQELTLQEV